MEVYIVQSNLYSGTELISSKSVKAFQRREYAEHFAEGYKQPEELEDPEYYHTQNWVETLELK